MVNHDAGGVPTEHNQGGAAADVPKLRPPTIDYDISNLESVLAASINRSRKCWARHPQDSPRVIGRIAFRVYLLKWGGEGYGAGQREDGAGAEHRSRTGSNERATDV
jgi:hypothetical protein